MESSGNSLGVLGDRHGIARGLLQRFYGRGSYSFDPSNFHGTPEVRLIVVLIMLMIVAVINS